MLNDKKSIGYTDVFFYFLMIIIDIYIKIWYD